MVRLAIALTIAFNTAVTSADWAPALLLEGSDIIVEYWQAMGFDWDFDGEYGMEYVCSGIPVVTL